MIDAPRRLSALGASYSLFVRVLKWAMPLGALVLAGVVVARLAQDDTVSALSSVAQQGKTTPGAADLVDAKYEGFDASGRPFAVTADHAARSMESPDVVLFDRPTAEMEIAGGAWVSARAAHGTFNRQDSTLTLEGDVTLFHDAGYEMAMEKTAVHLREKTAVADTPVAAQGPLGRLRAQNLRMEDGGARFLFGGPVHLTLAAFPGAGLAGGGVRR